MHGTPKQSEPAIRRRGVVAVVVREECFLVIRRAAGVLAPGKYCFPGGGIEANESEPEALEREIREELGVDIRPRACIWRSTTPWGVALAWWLGEVDSTATIVPNPDEVESFAWLSRDQMLALAELLESNRLFLDALAGGVISLVSR